MGRGDYVESRWRSDNPEDWESAESGGEAD